MKKKIQIFTYYVLPISLTLISFFVKDTDLFSDMGTVSLLLVTLVLFIKPLSSIFQLKIFKIILIYRREIAIASFWFFYSHIIGLYMSTAYSIEETINPYSYLFSGLVAGIGMIILTATSNNASIKYLKRNWKKVQRLAYPTYFLILVHASLATGENNKIIIFGGSYVILKFLEYKKVRFFDK